MPIRALLRYLLHNEQLIQKLADSYPIRRAAQLTTYFSLKSKQIGEAQLEKWKNSDMANVMQDEAKHSATKLQDKVNRSVNKTNRFFTTFSNYVKDEWKKEEEKLKGLREIESETKTKGSRYERRKKKDDT